MILSLNDWSADADCPELFNAFDLSLYDSYDWRSSDTYADQDDYESRQMY